MWGSCRFAGCTLKDLAGSLRWLAPVAAITCLSFAPAAHASTGLFGWGVNLSGQLGDGFSSETTEGPAACSFGGPETVEAVGCSTVPTPVEDSAGVVSVAPGEEHVLGLTPGGAMWAWGNNSSGQLGDGTSGQQQAGSAVPVGVSREQIYGGVTDVSAGAEHSLAVWFGAAWAWGSNEFGQIGDNKTPEEQREVVAPTAVLAKGEVVAVAAGGYHGLALLRSGGVSAWGDGEFGQLGNGGVKNHSKPVTVKQGGTGALANVQAIAAGEDFSLALLSTGTVVSWGDDESGQLGDGREETKRSLGRAISGLSGVVAIAAGAEHSLALLSNGTVMAWGDNEQGQLGDGTTTNRPLPVAVPGLSNVVAIAAGGNHSVALLANGTVYTWGENEYGQLGIGSSTSPECGPAGEEEVCSATPVQVPGLTNVTAIAAGYQDTFATGTYSAAEPMLARAPVRRTSARPARAAACSSLQNKRARRAHLRIARLRGTLWRQCKLRAAG